MNTSVTTSDVGRYICPIKEDILNAIASQINKV